MFSKSIKKWQCYYIFIKPKFRKNTNFWAFSVENVCLTVKPYYHIYHSKGISLFFPNPSIKWKSVENQLCLPAYKCIMVRKTGFLSVSQNSDVSGKFQIHILVLLDNTCQKITMTSQVFRLNFFCNTVLGPKIEKVNISRKGAARISI